MTSSVRTYQTRIDVSEQANQALLDCAALFAKVQHALFADISKGQNVNSLKSPYLVHYGITGRQFNGIKVNLEGKMTSIQELRKQQALMLKERIKKGEAKLSRIKKSLTLHQKKRQLHSLQLRLKKLQDGHIPLCFGTRKLFRAQFHLEENGYTSHEEWKSAWQHARASEIFFLGSKDEASGNQSCTATVEKNGSLSLRIRLPDACAKKHGKYLYIPNVRFSYGQEAILCSLDRFQHRQLLAKAKNPLFKSCGQALTYRLKQDEKGWTVFVTTELSTPEWISNKNWGVIGIDINTDHLAFVDIDRFGNPIFKKTIPLNLQGKSKKQSLALIGNASAEVVRYAGQARKPIVLENLNFHKKKESLRELSPSQARTLSSFAYQAILTHIRSRAWSCKIEAHSVNSAYTSLIGDMKFASRYGLSCHHAAALCIGRRFLKFSERMPRYLDKVSDGKGNHIALSLPVRNRDQHVWALWRQLYKKKQAALAARFRTKRSSSTVTTALVTELLPDSVGETPTRESSALLFS